jgi:hypothetical protein
LLFKLLISWQRNSETRLEGILVLAAVIFGSQINKFVTVSTMNIVIVNAIMLKRYVFKFLQISAVILV